MGADAAEEVVGVLGFAGLVGLIAYNIALIISADKISLTPRLWLLGQLRQPGAGVGRRKLAELIECTRCVSFWMCLAVYLGFEAWGSVPNPALVVAASAGLAGYLALSS